MLKLIFKPGYVYRKARVIITGIIPADQVTPDLFDTTDRVRQAEISQLIDDLNRRYGRNAIVFAAQKTAHQWQTKADMKSPCYTTDWRDLPKIELN